MTTERTPPPAIDPHLLDDLRVFATMASGAMFSRLRQKAHVWGMSWRTDVYLDVDNMARLQRAVDDLIAAVDVARRHGTTYAQLGEPWKRAADVANQAFMLADPLRRSDS